MSWLEHNTLGGMEPADVTAHLLPLLARLMAVVASDTSTSERRVEAFRKAIAAVAEAGGRGHPSLDDADELREIAAALPTAPPKHLARIAACCRQLEKSVEALKARHDERPRPAELRKIAKYMDGDGNAGRNLIHQIAKFCGVKHCSDLIDLEDMP